MTREEADSLATWLSAMTDTGKLWSVTVSEVRRTDESKPVSYRVLIERTGDPHPVAIYRARILTRAFARKAG